MEQNQNSLAKAINKKRECQPVPVMHGDVVADNGN